MLVQVIPTTLYMRQAKKLLTSEEQDQIAASLENDPNAHPVIPGTGGARKMRAAAGGRGKRGGVRVIYLHIPSLESVYLLSVYDKSQKENLSSKEKKAIAGLIDAIRRDTVQRSKLS
jgi:mRNA-degrading endonuclease RelE of RelBE toxin-antitoxin system